MSETLLSYEDAVALAKNGRPVARKYWATIGMKDMSVHCSTRVLVDKLFRPIPHKPYLMIGPDSLGYYKRYEPDQDDTTATDWFAR